MRGMGVCSIRAAGGNLVFRDAITASRGHWWLDELLYITLSVLNRTSLVSVGDIVLQHNALSLLEVWHDL